MLVASQLIINWNRNLSHSFITMKSTSLGSALTSSGSSFKVTAVSRWWCSSLASPSAQLPRFSCTIRSQFWTPGWAQRQKRASAWVWEFSVGWWPCWCPLWDSSWAGYSWGGFSASRSWWLLDSFIALHQCGCPLAPRWSSALSLPSSRFTGRSSSLSSTRLCLEPLSWCSVWITCWGRSCCRIRCMTCFVKLPHALSAGLPGWSQEYGPLWAL